MEWRTPDSDKRCPFSMALRLAFDLNRKDTVMHDWHASIDASAILGIDTGLVLWGLLCIKH